jgi:RecA-family ATPase
MELMNNNELDAQILQQDRKRERATRGFTLFADLDAESTKDWLVNNLLGAGEASCMYGKPGDGKSVLAQDLGLHTAAGWTWHGRPTKRGAVMYVALERRKLVERRAIAFRRKYQVNELPFAIVGGPHDFRDPKTPAHLNNLAKEVARETGEKVVLIIIDTLARALCGGDENSPKDMGSIVNATGQLQATGAHVLWVHHIPMDGSERMRGHGALLGALDTTMHVAKLDSIRTATVVKSNDSDEDEQVTFSLETVSIGPETTAPVVVPVKDPAPGGTTSPKLKKNQQTMFALLHSAGTAGLATADWNERARAVGIGVNRKADLYDLREQLKSKNLVRQYGDRWTVAV